MGRTSFGVVAVAAVISLVCGLVGGAGGAYLYLSSRPASASNEQPPPPPSSVRVITDQDAIVQAVAKVDPAVVKIVTTSVVEPADPFEFFFGGGSRIQQGVGSGVVFEYEGRKLVLTNTHVVGDAQQISIELRSGQKLTGKLLAYDRASDIAAVEIEGAPADLPVAKLGDSDQLRIGEWVVAIGHPYAFFDHTVTVGVVSAQGPRQIGGGQSGVTRNVIQTDAAINQGNSGGPLVNLAGEVVGINSMIYSPTGATVGIGFAIPINEAKQIIHFLVHGGPWVGIQRAVVNSEGLARYLGLGTAEGIVVLSVAPDSPAAQAGMTQGDVILQVDGQPVTSTEELRLKIFAHNIGDVITFLVQRGGQRQELRITAGKVPGGYYR